MVKVRVRIRVSFRVSNCMYGYNHVIHNYCVLRIMKIGASEAMSQKMYFLRCGSHSDTNLSGILLFVTCQT